ncbi:MAG: MBL fold metallo-hydrolase [Xanthomonadales bacterium]|nr:MBL fold metallo-hydrolase [Xanthomonadales bacterium]
MTHSTATLQFLGATGTVTGSRYLVEREGYRLLVDCGLFQGYKQLRERNRAAFPVDPASIDAVLLTHAHLDHSGYLPALVKQGFGGRIHATASTLELCGLLLPDSGHLQEEEAEYARRKGYSKHADPRPLYTQADAEACLKRFSAHPFEASVELAPGISARFIPAGHLLGAASIELTVGSCRLLFSGDLGRSVDPLMRPPRPFAGADVLLCESTYGNRTHASSDPEAELAPLIRDAAARGAVVIVPAFAIGRAQGLMLHLARLRQRGEIPRVPVFLNSPMAIDATEIYHRHHDEHHVSVEDCRGMYELATFVHTAEESKELNLRHGPMVIISASGMLSGGRVLHHLEAFGSDSRNLILMSGYQAGGTRGAALAGGARSLRMFGREVEIRAKVAALDSFSGHADANELLDWMRGAAPVPTQTYITHGDPDASDALRRRIQNELGWRCRVPEHLERVALPDGSGA